MMRRTTARSALPASDAEDATCTFPAGSLPAGAVLGHVEEGLQVVEDLGHVLERLVERRVADVGDLVDLPELPHDDVPNEVARDLTVVDLADLALDRVRHLLEALGRDALDLGAGDLQALEDLLPVEGLARVVALDDAERALLHALVSREATLAREALAATPDHEALRRLAGVEDLRALLVLAERTAHAPESSSRPVKFSLQLTGETGRTRVTRSGNSVLGRGFLPGPLRAGIRGMRTVPFQSILTDSRRGRPEFLDLCRAPALIVEGAAGKRPIELDGRSPYPPIRRTPTRLAIANPPILEPARDPYLEDAAIVWIEKSPRNSFTQIISLGRGPEN